MSQVNLLSVDVGQSAEMHGSKGYAPNKNQAKNSAFSDAMEQHYPTKKVTESDGKIERNGNLLSKAATQQEDNSKGASAKQVKGTKSDDAHILPVPLPADDEALAAKPTVSDDAHTLPVPIDGEALAVNLKTRLNGNDNDHTLPVPMPVDGEAVSAKLKTSDDAHILPVPLPIEYGVIPGKLKAGDGDRILPVILRTDDEALAANTKLKVGEGAHTLPVPISPDDEQLAPRASAKNDANILPVPVAPLSAENKVAKHVGAALDIQRNNSSSQQYSSLEQQIQSQLKAGNSGEKSLESDDAVDLLKMLSGAQKLLIKPNTEQAPLSVSNDDGQGAKAVVNSENTTKSFADKLAGLGTTLDAKQTTTAQATGNSLAIEQALNAEKIAKQSNAQSVIQTSKLAMDSKQEEILLQAKGEVKADVKGRENEVDLAVSKAAMSGKLSAENKTLSGESDDASVKNEKQQNAADFKAVSDSHKAQNRTINQSTASVVASSISPLKADVNEKMAMNEAINKSASTETDVELLAKAESDKQAQQPEKLASNFNQALDAQSAKPMLSPGELAARQEQSFESSMNKLTTDTVQTQKSITAINTETIAIYRKDFANAVKDKVMVMINQKIQQVEIQLDPPEMGNIHVRVNLQNEQAAVQFIVQNQQAKDALEQNMDKLRDMLAENGVDVGDANIEKREANEQGSDGFDGQADSGKNGESAEDANNENDYSVLNLAKASSAGVDYYA